MHTKIRGNRACLYRSQWIPKGANGNTHGYSEQEFVGSLPVDALSVSDALRGKLSLVELDYVERAVCRPAREAAERLRAQAEERDRDPEWRLADALALVMEAGQRSQHIPATRAQLTAISNALATVRVDGQAVHPSAAQPDALLEALEAIRAAATAVEAGRYGSAPEEGVRSTRPYRLWSEILEAVTGSGTGALQRSLQHRGFVKIRKNGR